MFTQHHNESTFSSAALETSAAWGKIMKFLLLRYQWNMQNMLLRQFLQLFINNQFGTCKQQKIIFKLFLVTTLSSSSMLYLLGNFNSK